MAELRAPEQLWGHSSCFLSSFQLLEKLSQVLLHFPQLLPPFPLVIDAKATHGLSVCLPSSGAPQALL